LVPPPCSVRIGPWFCTARQRDGSLLGFALIKPYDILQLEWEAKQMALAWFDRHADSGTIVFFCETSGTVV